MTRLERERIGKEKQREIKTVRSISHPDVCISATDKIFLRCQLSRLFQIPVSRIITTAAYEG
jgi:hypothetical protein